MSTGVSNDIRRPVSRGFISGRDKEMCTGMRGRHGIAVVAALTALVTATTGAMAGEHRPAAMEPTCELDTRLVPTCPGHALFGGWVKGYDNGPFVAQVAAAEARY